MQVTIQKYLVSYRVNFYFFRKSNHRIERRHIFPVGEMVINNEQRYNF